MTRDVASLIIDAVVVAVLRRVVRLTAPIVRLLGRIDDTLDARPKGKFHHRLLANLPVVGVLGGYAAEREALRRAAVEASAALTERPVRREQAAGSGSRTPHASRWSGSW